MFPPPPYRENEFSNVEVCKLESLIFPDSLAGSPLQTMVNLEKRNKKEIIAAETLVTLVKINEKINMETKATKLVTDIVSLQSCNNIYSVDTVIDENSYNFYISEVCCDVDKIIKISVQTLHQSQSDEWFKQRVLRITASNAHKLKGNRFDVDKVISDFLTPNTLETSAITYGRKMESIALKEYEGLIDPAHKVMKVGLIVNICQPWLSCSPDAVVEYGANIWQKRLVEIKCPYNCKKIPVFDRHDHTCNVKYLKYDENGLQLSQNHCIYTQIQVQMYVTNIAFCDLFVYSPLGSVLITVARDNVFLQKMY
ncbi:uncharacterized protein LOC141536872 [Cotesia typhae]|uniref:uncharacterized protein LOC141536872 n=1 Tax=Cotesia typhae TaxID=2053667 RepID=UPI003D683AD8